LAVDIFAPGVIQAPKLELRNMRYELSDFEWSVIKPMLPNKPRGMPRVDDRRVLNGIFWVLRSGAPWRDLPGIYGPCTTCYNRFVRWRRAGVWDRIMEALAAAHDAAVQMIDTSVVRVHQRRACIAGNREQHVGRARGGLTNKVHAVVDANGLPVRLGLTPGEAHDNRLCPVFLAGLRPQTMLLADRGYDADRIGAFVNRQGAWANMPPKLNRKDPICFSPTSTGRVTWSSGSSIGSSNAGVSDRGKLEQRKHCTRLCRAAGRPTRTFNSLTRCMGRLGEALGWPNGDVGRGYSGWADNAHSGGSICPRSIVRRAGIASTVAAAKSKERASGWALQPRHSDDTHFGYGLRALSHG
jgi:transposase